MSQVGDSDVPFLATLMLLVVLLVVLLVLLLVVLLVLLGSLGSVGDPWGSQGVPGGPRVDPVVSPVARGTLLLIYKTTYKIEAAISSPKKNNEISYLFLRIVMKNISFFKKNNGSSYHCLIYFHYFYFLY